MRANLPILALTFFLLASPVQAEEPLAVAVHAGAFSTLRGVGEIEVGGEVRFAPRRLHLFGRSIPWMPPWIPAAGAMVTSHGAGYVYGGGRVELPLDTAWLLTPSWGVGFYNRQPGGKDLGAALEFRSGIELSRRLGDRGRLGATLYHLSNGGLFKLNPGSESLVLVYSTGLR